MRIERSMHNEHSAAAVYAMVTDPAFQERKCQVAGALSCRVEIVEAAQGATVRVRCRLPPTGFPAPLRRVLPRGLTSTHIFAWGPAAADGARTGRLSVDFHGAPASLNGTVALVPEGANASTVVVDAEFRAHVPIIGHRIERYAAPIITAVIEAEETTGRTWPDG
jgi:hypothetical protein